MYHYFFADRKSGGFDFYRSYDIYNFPYQQIRDSLKILKNKNKKDSVRYYDAICTFDIESTTDPETLQGFMYIWQACINGYCVSGRTWESYMDFVHMLDEIVFTDDSIRSVWYVHNLAYEFQFFRQIITNFGELHVFASKERRPIKVTAGHHEYRCSYFLSNMSLYKATTNELGCIYIKSIGDLDYKIYRTPSTILSTREYSYCMCDVLSLYWYIKSKLVNEGDTLATIPLTSTGYVRRDCRRVCKASESYMKKYYRQTLSKEVYTLLKEAGRGGDTAANYRFAGQMIADVDSYDAVSSYPFQLLTKKFPCTRFHKYDTRVDQDTFERLISDGKALLARVSFHNLKAKPDEVDLYLSYSKCTSFSGKKRIANGRILFAENISYTITDIDYQIIKDCYTWDSSDGLLFHQVHYAEYDYLPEEIRGVILEYFTQKCKLKYQIEHAEENGLSEEEIDNLNYLYMKAKNRLNGIFGMMYTDPVRDTVIYTEDPPKDKKVWDTDVADIIQELKKAKSRNNNFLVYAWGVWTTVHARDHLHLLISLTGEGTVYWDTDSSKAFGVDDRLIEAANREIISLCLDREAYAEIEGERFYLGTFEKETVKGKYKQFKTLGAKKYAYVDYKGELHVTISGVAKSKNPLLPDGAREMKTIDNFKPGFIFREAGGMTMHYNDTPLIRTFVQGEEILTGSNVGAEDGTYTIGLDKEYAQILGINLLTDS